MTQPTFVEVDTSFIRMDIRNVTWFEPHHWAHLWSMVDDKVVHSVRLRNHLGQWFEADYRDVAVVLHPGVTHKQAEAYASLFDISTPEYWETLAMLAPRNQELERLNSPAALEEFEQQYNQFTDLGGIYA